MQACKRYHTMLLRVYGDILVLDPHVMDVAALKDYTTDGTPSFPQWSIARQRHVTRPGLC